GDYADYVRVKAETMHAQERRETVLANTLRRETEWLRRGAAARSTKQQARIARAGVLADEVAELGTRNTTRTAALSFQATERRPGPGAHRRQYRLSRRRLRLLPWRAPARARLSGALPVHHRSGRDGGRQAVGRRAEPPPAGAAHVARGAGAGAGRADQRSRSGDPVGAGGDADRVRGGGAPGLARSLLRRSRGDGDPGSRSIPEPSAGFRP